MQKRAIAALAVTFLAGLALGGYLFSATLPRDFLSTEGCGAKCMVPKELAGLITSLGLQRLPMLVPGVVLESDTCLVIRYPRPEARIHYVLFPKHDTRNIATLTSEDTRYVMGCFALVRELVARDHLTQYRVETNGPGRQEIAYLHFHLISN